MGDDLWLNESFAEWASHHALVHATSYDEAWTGFTNNRKNWAYRQDQLPSTHPIAADNHDLSAVEVNFDGITYAKGASALKQLVAWVGEEEFMSGLRAYFRRHAFGNSEFSDLLGALVESSGHAARVVYDAEHALEVASAFQPEVAILDIGLPRMDGYELGARLREQLAGVRLIALSGYATLDRSRTRAAGFHDHLAKPVSATTSLGLLEHLA